MRIKQTTKRLTPEQREQLLTRIASGASYEEARAWLKKKHKIDITKQAISKAVAKHRVERSDVSKAIARDHITRTLPRDLKVADDKHAQAARLLDQAARAAEKDPTVANFDKYAKASAAYLKFEEIKRKTLGLDQPDETFVDGLVDLMGIALEEEDEAIKAAAFGDDESGDPKSQG